VEWGKSNLRRTPQCAHMLSTLLSANTLRRLSYYQLLLLLLRGQPRSKLAAPAQASTPCVRTDAQDFISGRLSVCDTCIIHVSYMCHTYVSHTSTTQVSPTCLTHTNDCRTHMWGDREGGGREPGAGDRADGEMVRYARKACEMQVRQPLPYALDMSTH